MMDQQSAHNFWQTVDRSAGPQGCWTTTGDPLATRHLAIELTYGQAQGIIHYQCPVSCVNPSHVQLLTVDGFYTELPPIDIVFLHFRTLSRAHLEVSWASLARQDFTGVRLVHVLDNNSDESAEVINEVLNRTPLPVSWDLISLKHHDPTRTHSWSANMACRAVSEEALIFLTRADYRLDQDCLATWRKLAGPRRLVTSWCLNSYEPYSQATGGHIFYTTDQDAGVFLVPRALLAEVGWWNEGMVSWGLQQYELHMRLQQAGVQTYNLPYPYFVHQHHEADRDMARAQREYGEHRR